MSTHHDIENEQENAPQASPSVHVQETIQGQAVPPWQPPPPSRPPNRRWFTVVLVTIVVVLLVAVSVGIVALVRLSQPHVTPTTPTPNPTATTAATTTPVPTSTTQPTSAPTPPFVPGQWVQVLTGYKVTSLAAASSHPNVLYACAVPPGLPANMAGVQTVLRSADFGTTWQDIGSRAQMSRGCELTINPTDSYEIYVATSSNPPTDPSVPSYVLEHTSNGGDTWETIHPTVHGPGLNITPAWRGSQLSFVGNRLYSLQSLPIPPMLTPQGHQGPLPTSWTRLLVSTDSGYIWNVLDTQFATTWQSAMTYAVNPANPTIFYELVGLPAAVPGAGLPNAELYKSVDGGKTWQPALKQIGVTPSPIEILTGSENPNVVYLTNTRCPASQAFHTGGGPLVQPLAGGGSSLCLSSDAGRSWRTITPPDQLAYTMGGGVVDRQGRLYAQATASGSTEIWRYDPTAGTWSKVTQAPSEGNVLAGTSTGADGTTVLWLMSTTGQAVLYRYVI